MRAIGKVVLLAMTLAAHPVAAAEFAGKYAVKGTDPDGGSDYSGTVTLTRTAEAVYSVVWKIGGDTFVGTGIGGADGLAVGYKSGSNTGIAIYRQEADGVVKGVWTYAGGKKIGEEAWSR